MIRRAVLGVFLACTTHPSAAQAPRIEALLDHLVAYTADYRAKLPSLECEEDIHSEMLKGGKVKRDVKIMATLRETRDSKDPNEFHDSYTFHIINGKAVETTDGQPRAYKVKIQIPYFVEGAFANGLGFGGRGGRGCFEYRLTTEDGGATTRLEFWLKDGDLPAECNEIFAGYHKIVLVDTATGVVRHITRSMSADAAMKHREPDFASIDYAPQRMGDLEMWLPVRVEAHNALNDRRMTAAFSNYHRYTGEVRIMPGVEPAGADDHTNP